MSRHKRGHDQSKPYVCNTCGAAYADRKRHNEHIKTHESGTPGLMFNCDFCGFSSKSKYRILYRTWEAYLYIFDDDFNAALSTIFRAKIKTRLNFQVQWNEDTC